MELNFKSQILKFRKEGEHNLIAETQIGNYKQIEIDVNINQFTKIVDEDMILNVLEYVNDEIEEIEKQFSPLLNQLLVKFNFHLKEDVDLEDVQFRFIGVWIKSMPIFNSQFELVYYLDGNSKYSNLDITGKWTLNFSGSTNNWVISGVNRVG